MRRPSLPSPVRSLRSHARLLGALTVLAVAGLGGWLWGRDASVVRISHVEVTGATGLQASEIRLTLTQVAREMTTLHVRRAALLEAVAAYPQVRDVVVRTGFPHRARITVVERPPVAALTAGGRRVAVAADGTVLAGSKLPGSLPAVRVRSLPGGRATGRAALGVKVLAAAPAAMRAHVERVVATPGGLVADLRDGPRILLGDGARARAKWVAAARVLGDSAASGARYVDVRLPERAAAGGIKTSTGG